MIVYLSKQSLTTSILKSREKNKLRFIDLIEVTNMSKGMEFIIIWSAIVALIIISTVHNRISIRRQKRLVLILVFIFSFLYANRTLGLDLRNYIAYYNNRTLSSLTQMVQYNRLMNNTYEPVFTLWVYISKRIGLSFNWSLFVYVLVPMLLFYRCIIKKTEEPLISFMLFMVMFMFYFDLTRMFFALAFGLTAFTSKKKTVKALLYAISFFSHYTMVLMIIYEILASKKVFTRRSLFSLLVGSGIAAVVLFGISKVLESTGNRFAFKLLYYLGRRTTYVSTSHRILMVLISFYPVLVGLFFYKRFYRDRDFSSPESQKIIDTLKIGVATSIVSVFVVSTRTVPRIMLPALTPFFLAAGQPVADCVYEGKITRKGITIVGSLLLYDILMSVYYLWIAAAY